METQLRKSYRRRKSASITIHPPPSPPDDLLILKPAGWFIQIIAFHIELISSAIITCLSIVSESFHRAEEAKEKAEEAVLAVPSKVAEGGGLVFRKLVFGFLGAVYLSLVLFVLMILAILIGVALVRWWVEEPVSMRGPLYFDYTDDNPWGIVSLSGKKRAVPVGHTVCVSVVLLVPDSDYNRWIGVFQVTAEVLSAKGDIVARSSRPCMLHFRSYLVQLMRTFFLGIPLLLGISDETEEIAIPIIKYKEGNPKTEAIRIWIKPRAGTVELPHLYSAELLINSQLPWRKDLVHRWKWTFYVWTSLYVYVMLLVILVCWFKPFSFPVTVSVGLRNQRNQSTRPAIEDWRTSVRETREISERHSETLRRWHSIRNKRKTVLLQHRISPSPFPGSVSTLTREEMVEETGDSGESQNPVVYSSSRVTKEEPGEVVEGSGESVEIESNLVGS